MTRSTLIFAWGATLTVLAGAGCPSDGPGLGSGTDESTGGSSGATTSGTSEGEPATSTGAVSEGPTSGPSSGEPADTSAGEETTAGSEESTGTPDEPGPDLREVGPYAVETDSGTASVSCSMGYDLRSPAGVPDAPVVVLAHGFQGNRASMAGWAEHWASWGVRVVTPDLCHASIIDTDHAQNGADLRDLVAELSLSPVIYAGYSAGGLAAVVAAAGDDGTVALLGLDMVDNADLGLDTAPALAVPAFDIVGEPSMCNTSNNGLPVFGTVPGSRALRVTEADHCDFQNPADFICGLTCSGTNTMFDDDAIQSAVLGLSTAVVVWQTGLEPTGAQWWTPGEHYYDLLVGIGIVQEP